MLNKTLNGIVKACVFMIITHLLVSHSAKAAELKPFTSDGCSSFPDGTLKQKKLWLSCCQAHDYAYWVGGSYDERLAADRALKHCVASMGENEIAVVMLAGVRVGGSPYFPTTFRWGYGWPYPRAYAPLTEAEKAEITTINVFSTLLPIQR